ncbi:MAG: fumarylacetoacetate hydrolase family protein [Deltaproteobacteria bacterium]|nr:fumarylacetoacetate hydrolase family protein [Deltaproteobacteria bacterium]
MKIATFCSRNGGSQIGVVLEAAHQMVPLQDNHTRKKGVPSPDFEDMLAFLSGGERARALAREMLDAPVQTLALDEVTLQSPVPRPESIRDCMAFEQHIINCIRKVGLKKLAPMDVALERFFGRKRSLAGKMNRAWYAQPVYYKSNRFSVIGDGDKVVRPSYTRQLDYELEWGVFIGKQGRDIPEEKARQYIGGFTIFNDFSARDIQMKEQGGRLGPAKGKDFDTGNAIGPWLVTPDEIADPYNLTMRATVNGEEWSRGTTADMHYSFEEIIAYISKSETLYPGEFIGSGTCSGQLGSGCGLELGKFLNDGDTVSLSVSGIGTLTNTVASAGRLSSNTV